MVLNVLRALLNPLLRLFGIRQAPPTPPTIDMPPPPPTEYEVPEEALAELPVEPPPATLDAPEPGEAACTATIKPLGTVNLRGGPGLEFAWVERASGGMTFAVAEASAPDADGYAWLRLTWEGGAGWVRADLVTLQGECPEVDLP